MNSRPSLSSQALHGTFPQGNVAAHA